MRFVLFTVGLLFILQIHALAANVTNNTTSVNGGANATANAYSPGTPLNTGNGNQPAPAVSGQAPTLTNQNPNAPVNAFPNSPPSTAMTPSLSPDTPSQ
jgi:hypothetical protein